jgi:hypothetical protein
MWLKTGKDLKADALFLAGEPDTGSVYDSRVFEWLTVVQRSLVSGGQFGPSLLQPVDWPWARAWPRGAIQLVQPFNSDSTTTASFLAGNRGVTISPALPVGTDLTGFRIQQSGIAARHIVVRCQTTPSTVFVLREPWTGDTITTANWLAYPDTYDLPPDFVRGASPLYAAVNPQTPTWFAGPSVIDVVDPADLERMYPFGDTVAFSGSGTMPVMAARVSDTQLRFAPFLNTPQNPFPLQVEFEYISRPDFITEGSIPDVPLEHRRVLSYGAAYLILDDKDDSGSGSLWQKFQAQYQAMLQEYLRSMWRMSNSFGKIQPSRLSGLRSVMVTESGLPVYIW